MHARAHRPPHVPRHAKLDDGTAFIPDFREGFVEVDDGDAEAFAEEFVVAATTGEAVVEDARNEPDGGELSGWFIDDLTDVLTVRELAPETP